MKFVHLAVAGKSHSTIVHLKKKSVNKLDLIAAQYFWLGDHKIGPGGLLLVVPMYMQFQLQFYWQTRVAKRNCYTETFNLII
jgi:hypothetical protein